jgi:hypothetical protein
MDVMLSALKNEGALSAASLAVGYIVTKKMEMK